MGDDSGRDLHLPTVGEPTAAAIVLHPVITIRLAVQDEALAIADLYWRAREAAVPAIPPSVHPHDDVRRHFAETVLPNQATWIAAEGNGLVGLLVLAPGWVDHLYVDPGRTGEGIGARLLDHAKAEQPGGLDLWAFQSNTGARRFYERHGFRAVAFTDDENEERAPDVRYRWDG